MSGGEKQCLAIARAIHFGARVLILDEPTAALGVKQSFNVLKLIHTARAKGISVIFITHNVHHAYPIGDSFTLLNRGKSMGTFTKDDDHQGRSARHDGRRRRNAEDDRRTRRRDDLRTRTCQ